MIVHDMEAPELVDTAERVARWFAGPTAPQASTHYNVDSDSVVQNVRDVDVAWHAPGANHNGIGVEHAGYARQTRDEWLDTYGRRMLNLSAHLVAELCARYQIPIIRRRAAELRAGRRGITGHVDVSEAFRRSDHTDPGGNFPWDAYLQLVRDQRSAAAAADPPAWRWAWLRWYEGEGEFRKVGPRHAPSRPVNAPSRIPAWAWAWRTAFLLRRRRRAQR